MDFSLHKIMCTGMLVLNELLVIMFPFLLFLCWLHAVLGMPQMSIFINLRKNCSSIVRTSHWCLCVLVHVYVCVRAIYSTIVHYQAFPWTLLWALPFLLRAWFTTGMVIEMLIALIYSVSLVMNIRQHDVQVRILRIFSTFLHVVLLQSV